MCIVEDLFMVPYSRNDEESIFTCRGVLLTLGTPEAPRER